MLTVWTQTPTWIQLWGACLENPAPENKNSYVRMFRFILLIVLAAVSKCISSRCDSKSSSSRSSRSSDTRGFILSVEIVITVSTEISVLLSIAELEFVEVVAEEISETVAVAYHPIIVPSLVVLHHECNGVEHDEEEYNELKPLWRHEPPRLVLDAMLWNVSECNEIGKEIKDLRNIH